MGCIEPFYFPFFVVFSIILLHFKTSTHLHKAYYNFWVKPSFKSLFCLFDSSMLILNEIVSVYRTIQD